MYQNMLHADDSRLRNFPIEHSFSAQHYVSLPVVNLADLVRQRAGEALISLGLWIKPHKAHRRSHRQTTAWQGR